MRSEQSPDATRRGVARNEKNPGTARNKKSAAEDEKNPGLARSRQTKMR